MKEEAEVLALAVAKHVQWLLDEVSLQIAEELELVDKHDVLSLSWK